MKRYIRSTTISSKDVFDTSTTSTSYYDTFLTDEGLEYMQRAKNLTGQIVWGTPEEYFEKCAQMFHTSVDDLVSQRQDGRDAEYAQAMKEGHEFPLPYIYVENEAQEGLHRMLAAAIAFGWHCKVPWLEVKPYDVKLHDLNKKAQAANEYFKYDLKDDIDFAVNVLSDWDSPPPEDINDKLAAAIESSASQKGHTIEVDVDPYQHDNGTRYNIYLVSYDGYKIPVGQAHPNSPWAGDMFESANDMDIDKYLASLSPEDLELEGFY